MIIGVGCDIIDSIIKNKKGETIITFLKQEIFAANIKICRYFRSTRVPITVITSTFTRAHIGSCCHVAKD